MKATLIIVWTVTCFAGGGFLVWLLTGQTTYQGTNITFQVSDRRYVTINAETVRMEGADDTFFVLRNGGSVLVGTLTPKPLGWEGSYYFTAELDEAPGGQWTVEKGDWVTIKVVSESPVTIQVSYIPWAKVLLTALLVIATGVLWLFVTSQFLATKD